LTARYLVLHCNRVKEANDHSRDDKWMVQLRKGCLELAILGALWERPLYGLEILRLIESDSELIISEGTIYPLLARLKALGFVESEWVESESGHPRKYYALTAAGRGRALEMAAMWEKFSSSMGRVLGKVGSI
jgi:PadR family transcriptional regulator, regulatory protein PadR